MPATAGRRSAAIAARIPRDLAQERMLAALQSRVPAFAKLSPQSREDVLAGLGRTLRRWSRVAVTGALPGDEDFAPLRDWARQRANDGVLLEDLLHGFGVLHQAGWELLREHSAPQDASELLELAGLLGAYLDRVSVIVTETYMAQRDVLVSEEERRARALLDALLAQRPLDGSQRELAHAFGLQLGAPLAPFAAAMGERRAHRHAALAARLRRRGAALAVTESDAVVGLAPRPMALEDLEEGPSVLLAVDGATRAADLGRACADVMVLLAHGRRRGAQGRLTVEEHLLETILERSPQLVERLCERALGPLRTADPGGELERTLRGLFACKLDRRRTSERLHIHRNTLAYRLAKIEQVTGLDLDLPRDIARIAAALDATDAPPGRPG
jgi:PucR C-terminal helix-turn-helix domain